MRCEQPTFLTQIIGHDQMAFNVDATSTYGIGVVDVAFVFDVSGSMNSAGRLDQLKTAASAEFDELLPDDRERDGSVRIAVTSYNHSLNAGPLYRRRDGRPDAGGGRLERRGAVEL